MKEPMLGVFPMRALPHGLIFSETNSLGRARPLVNKQRPFFSECFFSSELVLVKVLSQEFILREWRLHFKAPPIRFSIFLPEVRKVGSLGLTKFTLLTSTVHSSK